ncbi:MAG: UDP-galactose-4-epimerase [Mucilaginibacter sp.]|nr:UDP-galactose-4-epimerase [Mucilaginibacter sp.]
MIVLITGASGFLGIEVVKQFQFDKTITMARNNAQLNFDLCKEIPKIPDVDLVVHCAGKAHFVPKTKIQKKEFFDVNVTGTANLLKGLENSVIPKSFVFISSVSVYGLQTGKLIAEDSPLLAKDPYGKSKIEAERLILDWCEKNKVICTILRLPLIAGSNPPGNLGDMIKGIKKGYYFNIAGGLARKSIVLANDVAEIIPHASQIGGIYNLTDGSHPDFLGLSKLIATQLNKKEPGNIPLNLAVLIARFGDLLNKVPLNSSKLNRIVSELTFDDSKARKHLNWNPHAVLDKFQIY